MINIAIDGPAGAGKSSAAKELSKKLGFIYVDTGALYRAVGLYALRKNVSPDDAQKVVPLLPFINLSLKIDNGEQKVFLNGEDVSKAIRTPEASKASSLVSAIPKVREYLLDLQRNLARENNCIMDGRDIGTVILPDADFKFFVTASPEIRADRRYKELLEKGVKEDYDKVLNDIIERDKNDSTRKTAPLKPAPDAILIDTSGMTLNEVVDKLLNIINDRNN